MSYPAPQPSDPGHRGHPDADAERAVLPSGYGLPREPQADMGRPVTVVVASVLSILVGAVQVLFAGFWFYRLFNGAGIIHVMEGMMWFLVGMGTVIAGVMLLTGSTVARWTLAAVGGYIALSRVVSVFPLVFHMGASTSAVLSLMVSLLAIGVGASIVVLVAQRRTSAWFDARPVAR